MVPSSRRDESKIAQDNPERSEGAVLGERNKEMKLPCRGSTWLLSWSVYEQLEPENPPPAHNTNRVTC